MESFAKVLTRTAFSSSFQRYWVVLDGQNLTYYENFDFKSQSTINVKNSLSIRDTKIVALKDNENSTKFGVKIISARGLQLTLFDCESAEDREVWIKALNRASKMHDDINNELSLIRKYLTILNMNPADDKTISKQDIIQNYKKCARLLHPDKGGDLDKFKIINEAYSFLCTVYDDRETLKAGKVVDYEAIVEKAGDGIGLGIVVNEDQVKRQIVVKSVHNQIQLHGLSTEANGAILPGDILIAIDGDDCSDWFLSRIRARLSNSRVPLGAKVHFTFERLLVDRQTDVPSEIEWQDKTNSTQVLSADISTPKKFIRTENRVVDSDDDDDHDNDHQHHHPDTKQEDHTQLPQTTITSDNEKKILEMR
jgi:curved DNA-binding protein CbpA